MKKVSKKQLKEWEKEAKEIDEGIKEADKDIKHMGSISFIAGFIILLLYILSRYL